ncbi:MAG: hypothetical protein KF777_14090 [Planctomycetaceae bacterium]|nr:hypothetical protein [Planctomycetaceae bacterium]
MSDVFETVGTYFNQTEAQAALLALRAEGIVATLQGAEFAAMDWLMINAMGGIKLKTPIDQADQAREILEALGPKASSPDDDWDDDQDGAGDQDDNEFNRIDNATEPDDDGFTEPNQREKLAARALNMVVFGYVIWPFHIYAWYLLVRVFTSDEPMAPRYRRRGWIAFCLTLPIFLISLFLFREMAVGRL